MEDLPTGHSRRSVATRLAAAALVALVAFGAHELWLSDEANSERKGSRVVSYELESELIGETLPIKVVIPPGAQDGGSRALLVFLHGRDDNERTYLESEMFDGLASQQGKAPVVAFPRGGPDSYWHDREDGEWGSYVLDEVVPALVERFEIEPERVAIGGISMGGFGAYDIARQDPELFCTVGAHSAALWENPSDAAQGAFDNSDDFDRHDPIEQVGPPTNPLDGKRLWLDIGDEDPFLPANMALAEALGSGGGKVELVVEPGAHQASYWDSNWRRYMRFYATQLKRCQPEPRAPQGQGRPDRPEQVPEAESSGGTPRFRGPDPT